MNRWLIVWLAILLVCVGTPVRSASAAEGDVVWTNTFILGDKSAEVNTVAAHSSGVYSVGEGGGRAFMKSHTAGGKIRWSLSFTTAANTLLEDVAVDDTGVYVVGWVIERNGTCADYDAFVRRFTHQGTLRWSRQISGSTDDCWRDPTSDEATGVAIDSSGVYVTGYIYGAISGHKNAGLSDIFVRKYSKDGSVVWTRQHGTKNRDFASQITLDPWGVLVSRSTLGAWQGKTNLGGFDAFVRKYSRNGELYWTRQFGTSESDGGGGIVADGANFYVGGGTSGRLPGQTSKGESDGWLRKYRGDGTLRWTRQFGTSASAGAGDLTSDGDRIYLIGGTYGSFGGYTNKGEYDVFITNFSSAGDRGWTRQFGTNGNDYGSGIALGPRPTDSQQNDDRGLYVGGGFKEGVKRHKAFVYKFEE